MVFLWKKRKSCVVVILLFISFITNNLFALGQTNVNVLPDYLANISEEKIINMFLEIADKDNIEEKFWKDIGFVEQSFFKKLDGGFQNFLNSTATISIDYYPLEALLWVYSKDEYLNKHDVEVMGLLYDISRKGRIIPRSPINIGNIKAVDIILDTYFYDLKDKRRRNRSIRENSLKQKIIQMIEYSPKKIIMICYVFFQVFI